MPILIIPIGMNIAIRSLVPGPDSFTIPDIPEPPLQEKVPLDPRWTTGPSDKDPYAAWDDTQIDGVLVLANSFDQPWLVNDSVDPWTNENLGGAAPGEAGTEHASNAASLALWVSGTYLANGEEATYYVTLRNDRLGRETAPQTGASMTISNGSGSARGVTISIITAGLEAWWTHWSIYRRFKDASGFKKITTLAIGTTTYNDDTTWAALETADAWLPRYRRTLPPIFCATCEFGLRLIGWTGNDSTLWVGQLPDLVTGEFIQDDFYTFFQVAPGDGYGDVKAVFEHNGFLYVFKQRAIYIIEGDDPENWTARRMYAGRGTPSWRTIVPVRDYFAFLDTDGLLLWTPGGEPVMAGASEASFSPLSPVWDRMNLGVADTFDLAFNEETGEIEIHIAVDFWPSPNSRVIFSTNEGVFTSFDPGVWANCVNQLEDAGGGRHLCRGAELGDLWEEYIGRSEGVVTGDKSGTLTGGSKQLWTCGAAAFSTTLDGPVASPADRYNSLGVLLETNRVFAVGPTFLTPLYWSSVDVASGNLASSGIIPAIAQTPPVTEDEVNHKRWNRAFLVFEQEDDDYTVDVSMRVDDGDWGTIAAIDLSLPRPDGIELTAFGYRYEIKIEQRWPSQGFAWTRLETRSVIAGTWGNE